MEDTLRQTKEEKELQKEEIKPTEKMIKTKILGVMLLIFTAYWTYLIIYQFITSGSELNIYITLFVFVFSYIVGIALIMIKKRGIYHILIALCGIILLAFYVLALVGIELFSLWE